MASINKVFLIGNLGQDPEVRYTQSGNAVANFRIATTEVWNNRDGERQERTEWHRIVVWGRSAELCGEYLRKGRSVHIEGRLQTRDWEDREGQKRYTTEIIADRVTFLGGRNDGGSRDRDRDSGGYSGGSYGGGSQSYSGSYNSQSYGGSQSYSSSNQGSYGSGTGSQSFSPSNSRQGASENNFGGGNDDIPPLDDSDIPF